MNPTIHSKQDIAMQHLNLALIEYIKGQNPYSVLHLVGAAEEMLGKLVQLKNKRNGLMSAIDWMQSWWKIRGAVIERKEDRKRILHAKNGVKHIDGIDDLELSADIPYEIKETIRRALQNFNQLNISLSPEILEYYKHERNVHVR
jgi:hypothetical protein